MSFTSSFSVTPTSSPSNSLPTAARSIQIGFSPSGMNAPVDVYPSSSTRPSHNAVYSYASSSFNKSNSGRPTAYVSDEDLFGEDEAPYLHEAPPPPRPAQAWTWTLPQPLLPPLTHSRRRSSSNKEKKRRTSSSSSKK